MEKQTKQPRLSKVLIKGVEWTPEKVKESIRTNDAAVKKALLRVYEWQTMEEKNSRETLENNGRGFNGQDGPILSSFAEHLKTKGFLSQKQILIARKKLLKYSRQIFDNHIAHQRQEIYKKFGV